MNYEKPMKKFLNDLMVSKQKLSETETEKIRLMFEQTCADVVQQLGEKPFHLRSRTLNPGMLDAVMVMMSLARDKGITDGGKRYQTLRSDQAFLDTVLTRYTSETHMVRQRFEHAKQIMLG